MLPVNTGGHSAYQNFVTENLRKYYPNPDLIPRATWDIIERFWHLDLSYTDEMLRNFKVDSIEKVTVAELLPELENTLLDSAHDAMPYYEYCKREHITPFIDLNAKAGRPPVYKDDFTIETDGVPICKAGFRMRRDGVEKAKGRTKFKCPKMNRIDGCLTCTCEAPCSDAKYGRTVHLVIKDNPRLFNDPPRSSKEWKMEYNARTSVERSNKVDSTNGIIL